MPGSGHSPGVGGGWGPDSSLIFCCRVARAACGFDYGLQLIELLVQRRAPGFAHLYIRDGAALVITYREVIAVRDQVVGGLEPVGVLRAWPRPASGPFPTALHSTSTKGSPATTSCNSVAKVQQVSLGVMLPYAFPHHETEPGGLLLLAVAKLLE